MVAPTRTLHGVTVPSFFYGTAWKEERTEALTRLALDAGFLAIDTANQRRHYFEAAVGEAIADSGRARAGLFLQTKFTHLDGQDHRLPYDRAAPPAEQVAQSFASSLEHLHTDYLDAYILHGPSARVGLPDEDWQVWEAMSELAGDGRVHLMGISNVTLEQLATLHEHARVKPAFVQNRCYARTGWDREIRAFCRAHDIAYQGFSLLTANRRELAGPTMARITAKTGRTAAQVVFRFALAVGMIPLTGTTDAGHMREDLASFDFALDEADVAAIEAIA
jgi:diketogulonate reductase-like aldo/keto reductase